MSLHVYWAQFMILPRKILQHVNKMCRAYLWTGAYYSQKPENVKWESVFCNKREGGLGIRNTLVWNQATLGRYVWAIATKRDNLWII